MMDDLKLRVSIALNTNINTIFQPIVEAAGKAAKEIEKRFRGDIAKLYQVGAERAAQSMRKISDATKRAERGSGTSLESIKAKFDKLSQTAKKELNLKIVSREAERELKRIERQAARTALGIGGGGSGGGGDTTSRLGPWAKRTIATVTPMLSYAKRAALDITRGAGVSFDLSSMVGTHVEHEKLATELSNQAYTPGKSGAAGVRQDPRALMEDTRRVANESALTQTAALQGMGAFVDKTGDLETARAVFGDLAKLSRATGTALEDMVSASGDVANALGETDDKAGKVAAVMHAIAGQGKLGAVEIKDLSVQMAKLATAAPAFEGNPTETMKVMGALAQEARQRGGAAKPDVAVRSAAGVLDIFRTPARVSQFQAAGIDVFKGGKIRDIREIVVDTLTKTNGDPVAFKKLFANKSGTGAVEGFATVYREAGGGEKGVAAVRGEFDRLLKSSVDNVNESFARSMDTTEAKAQIFQNKLQEIVGTMADRVIPKLLELAPTVERATSAFANIVAWAAENPAKAIMAAFATALAKVAAEQGFRIGVKSLVASFGNRDKGKQIGPITTAGQGFLGNAMAGMTIAATALTIEQAGEMYINQVMKDKSERDSGNVVTPLSTEGTLQQLERGGIRTPEDRARAEKARGDLEKQLGANADGPGVFERVMGRLALNGLFGGDAQKREERNTDAQAKHLADMKVQLDRLNTLLGGTLKVNVANQPGAPPPRVNDTARTQAHP